MGTQLAGAAPTIDGAFGQCTAPPNASVIVPVDLVVMAGQVLYVAASVFSAVCNVTISGEQWVGDGFALA